MNLEDRYGLKMSTISAAAASAYCDGVNLMLSAWTGAAAAFVRAIAADADFGLAHVARSRIHTFYQQGEAAAKGAGTARALVGKHGTEREKSHVAALSLDID